MPKRSQASYRRAALKGWRTRRRHAKERGKPPRKKRQQPNYGGIELEAGYEGRDNSFSLRVIIHPYKNLTDDQIADLVEDLAQSGHFDASPNNPTGDLRWTFFNTWRVIRRKVRIARGKARLTGFARVPPGTL